MWTEVPSTTAQKPESPPKQPCSHKWVYQGSDYLKRERSYYVYNYQRIDTYYCEKCLEIKEVITKDEDRYNSDGKPCWFKG